MRFIKQFENFSIMDDINMILLNLSDSSSELISNDQGSPFKVNDILLYDLKISGDSYDEDELESAKNRLGDLGYMILQISRTCNKKTWIVSIIKKDLYYKLVDNDIIFWSDLVWKESHLSEMNRIVSSQFDDDRYKECLDVYQSIFRIGNMYISILDGKKTIFSDNEIEILWNDDTPRFTNKCEAEIFILAIQIEHFSISI